MDVILGSIAWLLDPVHWSGPDGIPTRLFEHLWISAAAMMTAAAIAFPVGLYTGHTGRLGAIAVNAANLARAVPSYAVLVIVLPISLRLSPDLGLNVIPTFVAMTVLAIPPILVGTHTGLRGVDADLVEAARAMGMRAREVVGRVELPLALPVVLGGFRTAAVQVIATATLGAVVAYGGLGRYLIDGIARQEPDRLFAGVILVAALALAAEGLFAVAQRAALSPGLRASAGVIASAPNVVEHVPA
jgi:osmoprotectant transport system permease protein